MTVCCAVLLHKSSHNEPSQNHYYGVQIPSKVYVIHIVTLTHIRISAGIKKCCLKCNGNYGNGTRHTSDMLFIQMLGVDLVVSVLATRPMGLTAAGSGPAEDGRFLCDKNL